MKKNYNRNPKGSNQWVLRSNQEIQSIIDKHPSWTKKDFRGEGKQNPKKENFDTSTVEGQIIKILETKIRPAVARDGGDIKFKNFENGVVRVELQGACSGCPSAALTLKQGVQNLLCHYIPEVKEVEAV